MERQIALTVKLDEKLGAVWRPDGTCKFLLWAPKAKKVEVRIEGARGTRTITLEALERGYFFGAAKEVSAGALYQYVLDGKTARPDPASEFQPRGVHGPSQVMDGRFDWNDKTWRGLELKKYVLYELHVGTFTPEGTFDAIIPRIAIPRWRPGAARDPRRDPPEFRLRPARIRAQDPLQESAGRSIARRWPRCPIPRAAN